MNTYAPNAVMGLASRRRQAAFLLVGAVIMLAAAWAVAPMAGVPIAVLAGLYGWLASWFMRPPVPIAIAAPIAAVGIPPEEPEPAPDERTLVSVLRHDLRGMMSPALLVTDRLLTHEDPAVQRAGEVVARTVQRVTDRLEETRGE